MLPKPKVLSIARTSRALRASAHTLLTPPKRCEERAGILGSRVQPWPGMPVLDYAISTFWFGFVPRSLPAPEKFGRGCQAALAHCCAALGAAPTQQAEDLSLTEHPCAAHTPPPPDFRVTSPIWSQTPQRSTWSARLTSSYKHNKNKGFS